MDIVLNEFGLFLGRKGNRFVVRSDADKHEIVSDEVKHIRFLNKGNSISVSALSLAMEKNIFVSFANMHDFPYGFLVPATISGTVIGRREQYAAYNDKRGVELAKKFVLGKSNNQKNLLRLIRKNRKTDSLLLDKLDEHIDTISEYVEQLSNIDASRIEQIRMDILNIEALISKEYWDGVQMIIPPEFGFHGRKKPNARDTVNALLNFGYKAILFVECWKAILYAGMDPYAGFLHSDRSGKPSLALDFMEEFRQHVVDRVVFSMVSRKQIRPTECGYVNPKNEGVLDDESIKMLTELINVQFGHKVNHNDKQMTMRQVIQYQANSVVRFLRGTSPYKSFELMW